MKTVASVFTPVEPGPVRRAAARGLSAAGRALERLSHALHAPLPPARRGDPVLEFHAEAGAPEGALYVDGQRVGLLPGVTRL